MPTLPTRQNNPGDLKQGGTIATYNSSQEGKAALYNDLTAKMTGKSGTGLGPDSSLVDFSKTYAPSSDGNDSLQYAANLANKLGVSPDTKIGSLTSRIDDLASAISSNEGYQSSSPSQSSQPAQMPGLGALSPDTQRPIPQMKTEAPVSNDVGSFGGKPIVSGLIGGALKGNLDQSKFPFGTGTIGSRLASVQVAKQYPDQAKDIMASAPNTEQTIGAGLQAASLPLGLAAAPATIPGAMAVGGILGASQGGGKAMEQNQSAPEVGKQAAFGGMVGAGTAGVVSGLGKLLGNLGDKMMYSEIRPSKADLEDGFSLQTIKDNDLGGTLHQILDKTQTKFSDLHSQLNATLANSNEKLDLAPIFDQTVKDVKNGGNLMKGFGSNTSVDSALNHLQNEVLTVNPDGGISIPDAQLVKQGAGGMGAWEFGKTDPDATARQIVYNKFYSNLKTAIEKASPDGVKEINAQMSKLIPVQNAILRRLPVVARNNPLSLTDFIGLVSSAAHPAALGPTILNFLSKSGAVGNALSKFAPSAGTSLGPKIGGMLSGSLTPPTTTSQ